MNTKYKMPGKKNNAKRELTKGLKNIFKMEVVICL
jgi:hypothetical protein